MCSTISTAYVHGGRPGVLPETAVAAAEPPSLWHPLEPAQAGKGRRPAVAVTADGSLANGHADHHSNGDADAPSRRASVPGVYFDLESELAYAQVGCRICLCSSGEAARHVACTCIGACEEPCMNQ